MNFNYLLEQNSIDPATTLCMRHKPAEADLRRSFLWLAAEKPEVFDAYQSTQKPREEKQLQKAHHVAAFIGDRSGRAVFAGLYKNNGHRMTTLAERKKIPGWAELTKFKLLDAERDRLWFDLERSDTLSEWVGKLVVSWTGERSWSRWAAKNDFSIVALNEESLLVGAAPDWREFIFSWQELKIIPSSWCAALAQWRGVYYIFDTAQGRGYVGSAYGTDNILGRWNNYARSGHGENKLLKQCKPDTLRFSILERLSPDTPMDEVIARENSWKERLHTRGNHGLNAN